jgi:phage repressor protein C with HTH and peptisase S24 domain
MARENETPAPFGSAPRSLLKTKREEMKLTPEQLAKLSRVPAQYIRDVESGVVQGSNEKQLRKLEVALKLEPGALMSGSDHPPIVGDHVVTTFGKTPDVQLTGNITAKTIPLISMAQAGDLVEFEDVYDHEGVVAYAGKDPRAIAVRIRGESMMPTYEPGTIAIVYPSFKPQNDNLVVAKVRDGSVLFKRLQIRDGEAVFHSINPSWPPMTYAERDIVWMYPVGLTQKMEL